jgi:prophage regulatory protein
MRPIESIDIGQVMLMTGLRRSTIYQKLKERKFPAPMKAGKRNVWLKSDIEKWVMDRHTRAQAIYAGAA